VGIILAGGIGSRMENENVPKQYIILEGKPVIVYSLEAMDKFEKLASIVIVADNIWHNMIIHWIHQYEIRKKIEFALPGESRQMSTFHALQKVGEKFPQTKWVMVHDAARPLLKQSLLWRCFNEIAGNDGVLPVLKMKDTMYFSDEGNYITEIPDRNKIFAGQSPEVFDFKKYYDLHLGLSEDAINRATGGSVLAFENHMKVKFVKGDPENIKITSKEDLEIVTQMLRKQ
jgi:2-C-methyl-D-erythritol 4-phosphate cytidylyltransferase